MFLVIIFRVLLSLSSSPFFFLAHMPFLLLRCPAASNTPRSSFYPPALFVSLVPFLFHFIIICCSSPWKMDATPHCQSSLFSVLKTRSQAFGAGIANCILMPPNGVCASRCSITIRRMLLLIVLKFTTLIKVFIDRFLCEAASPEWGKGGGGR